jgi:ATP-dependent DNA helicase RecQ
LLEHFGQQWTYGPCNACDVCLGKLEFIDDALVVGQKILSCVLRVEERYGADYVSQVLTGSRDQRIVAAGHDKLSTWGLLRDFRKQQVRQWIEQLVGQGFLVKEGEFNVVRVTDEGRRLLAGQVTPTLLRPVKDAREKSEAVSSDSWEGVDRELFDALRQLRRNEAAERAVPTYIVFSDATLRDMARQRPSTLEGLLRVRGVGQKKLADFGQRFVDCIVNYCGQNGIGADVEPEPPVRAAAPAISASAVQAFPLFDEGLSVEQVAERMGRAVSTTYGYLDSYIRQRRMIDASRWIPREEVTRIEAAIAKANTPRLKPVFDALGGEVSYEWIRIVVACMANQADQS